MLMFSQLYGNGADFADFLRGARSRRMRDISQEKSPMHLAAISGPGEPLPLGTAVLSNVALSLFMWNIAFRLVRLLFQGVTTLLT